MISRHSKSIYIFILLKILTFIHLHPLGSEITHHYKFEKVLFPEDLPQSSVFSIIQNRQGFMWFGTHGGLVKYDGYDIRVFTHDPDDQNSIGNNAVNVIFEDRNGNIWLGLRGGGLDRLDPVSEKFTHFTSRDPSPTRLSNNYVFAICQDKQGVIWTGNYLGGLNRLTFHQSPETGPEPEFQNFFHNQQDRNSLSNDIVHALCTDRNGNIWIGTENGLNRYDPDKNTFERFYSKVGNPDSLSSNRISCLYEDSNGILWVGTHDGGLNRVVNHSPGPSGITFTRFMSKPGSSRSISSNAIHCIFEDSNQTLWVGTRGGGLNILDRETGHFTKIRSDSLDPASLSDEMILSFCEDKTGILWVGLVHGSINKLNLQSRHIINITIDDSRPHDMVNSIYGIHEDTHDSLWVGSEYGQLCRYVMGGTGSGHHGVRYPLSKKCFSICRSPIRNIFRDNRDILWLGTMGEGIFLMDSRHPERGIIKNLRHRESDPNSINSDHVYSIIQDRGGQIWVGTGERGVSVLHPDNRETWKFIHIRSDPDDPHSISHNYITTIYEDRSGTIWIGTNSRGLNRFDRERNHFIRYAHQKGNSDSISSNKILSILEDSSRTLWFGTGDSGVDRLIKDSGTFVNFSTKDGLPDNKIYGILEDDQKNLWFSTNNGLSKFNPQTKRFVNFSMAYGFQNREFNTGACFKSQISGQLYFGGLSGISTFLPETLKQNSHTPPILVPDITIMNKSSRKRALLNNTPVFLSHNDFMFSFEFVALDYTDSRKNRYAYQLSGFNNTWIHTDGSRRVATYTNIPPGKYNFRVIGSNNHGIWNREGISIPIVIIPAFWQTGWFKIILIILLSASILTLHRRRVKKIRFRLKTENEISRIYKKAKITSREIEIIQLLIKRKSYKEIEDKLFISFHTVKNHAHSIFKKLNVQNRAELTYFLKSVEDQIRREHPD